MTEALKEENVIMLDEVRCRGCLRYLGLAPRDYVIYCDLMCANDVAITMDEARNSLIATLWLSGTFHSKAALAKHLGFTRQRIDQILRDQVSAA